MSKRIPRVQELLRRELALIIAKKIHMPNVLVTLTRVEISEDLQYANVYFSSIPDEAAEQVSKRMNSNIFFLQQVLNKRLRMRPVPKVRFLIDREEQEAAKIDQIIERIDASK